MTVSIRPATSGDAEVIQTIEEAADGPLIEALGASSWPAPADAAARLAAAGFVLVLVDDDVASPIGFAHVLDVDEHAHLDQLSVLPEHVRRGHGRRLLVAAMDEARRRGHSSMTLRTYAEIPWNAPFYASCGFLESIPETPFQRALADTEAELGLDRYGRRVQLTVRL